MGAGADKSVKGVACWVQGRKVSVGGGMLGAGAAVSVALPLKGIEAFGAQYHNIRLGRLRRPERLLCRPPSVWGAFGAPH